MISDDQIKEAAKDAVDKYGKPEFTANQIYEFGYHMFLKGAELVKSQQNKTTSLQGVSEIVGYKLPIITPEQRFESLCEDWNSLNGKMLTNYIKAKVEYLQKEIQQMMVEYNFNANLNLYVFDECDQLKINKNGSENIDI